ncbi:MAG: sporulation transcriptional regulator SpoIIID [Hespellia sp.]|nr:sporulation transcriptional regulator SpoIIID [Hespellia sp.]
MDSTTYDLRYLPLFYEELDEKVSYITETLKNKDAAKKFGVSKSTVHTDMTISDVSFGQ